MSTETERSAEQQALYNWLEAHTWEQHPNPLLSQPWAIEVDGETWSFGTDGFKVAAVRANLGLPSAATQPKLEIVTDYVRTKPTGQPMPLASLIKWLRDQTQPSGPCFECQSKREVACSCEQCGNKHMHPCDACRPFSRSVRIGHVRLNGVWTLDLVEGWEDETVRVKAIDGEPLFVFGKERLAVQMGMMPVGAPASDDIPTLAWLVADAEVEAT